MSKFFVFAILLAICLCYVSGASIGGQILDAQTAIRKIIAEYERLPGRSVHHPPEIAHVIDPNNFHLNF